MGNQKIRFLLVLAAPFMASHFTVHSAASNAIFVKGGDFTMGCSLYDEACDTDEGPKGGVSIRLSSYSIDRNEVTVEEYQQCITAGKCTPTKTHQQNGYCNLGHQGRLNHPINCVDWQQASQYCGFVGGRLPYEVEWEKAARAGDSSRPFPWGDSASCKNAILDDGKTQASAKNQTDGCGEDHTWPVRSRKTNRLKMYDTSGNVAEWTYNWYSEQAIETLYRKKDFTGPATGTKKVVRGGRWFDAPAQLRSTNREALDPVSGSHIYGGIGFRCAYQPAAF